MAAYYSDGRGRYGTGESYDWFWKYEEDDTVEITTSSDDLWTYAAVPNGIELLRYNGDNTNIVIPEKVDGKNVVALDSTFDGFYELKSVIVPEGVTSIVGAFYGCEGLEQAALPEGIVDMEYAFNCCYSLKNIAIPSSARRFPWTFGGTGIESIAFPQGTEDISHAFLGSASLKSVFIPKSVTDSYEAFSDCESLTDVVIEDGVKKIDQWAFYHCPALLELTIPGSVTEFGDKSVGYMEIREYISPQKTAYRIKGKQIVPGFQIKGISGSAAEQYARENKIPFIVLP